MQALRSVLGVGMAFWTVLVGAAALGIGAERAEGVMITYISSTRYIQGNAIPREDAVGFNDFDVSRVGIVGPTASGLLARLEASQTSRLLADRIEVAAATLTQFLQNPQGNSISADSICSIVFSIDEASQVTLSTGQIFSQSSGGIASAALLRNSDQTALLVASQTSSPMSVTLLPGEYKFTVASRSGSLQSNAGGAQAVATLVIPAESGLATIAVAAAMTTARRKRQD